jgi:hypothetical protein
MPGVESRLLPFAPELTFRASAGEVSPAKYELPGRIGQMSSSRDVDFIVNALQIDGICIVESFVAGKQLADMQTAFSAAVRRPRINNIDGYEKTETLRDMVEHPLLLDRGFLDLGIDPVVTEVARRYVGPEMQLTECKGWRSRTSNQNWHGWHGDSWYDQSKYQDSIPREMKLGLYLTDVSSGGLAYVKGSHRQLVPALHSPKEASADWERTAVAVNGPAGTVVFFDTSGVHRQSCPILQLRHALFYCYHDPAIPLQAEDVAYNRYHPLHLNAAFLGNLSAEDQRVLGFGDQRQFVRGYQRTSEHAWLHSAFAACLEASIWMKQLAEPVARRGSALYSKLLPGKH